MTGATLPAGCLCLFTGALLGGVFLGLKLLKLLLRGGRLFIFFSDLLFGLLCALAAFVVALAIAGGRLRMFQAVLQGLGAWGAIVALDPLLSGAALWLRRLARRVGGLVRQTAHRLMPKRKPRRKKLTPRKASAKKTEQSPRHRVRVKRQKKHFGMRSLRLKKPNGLTTRK